MTRPAECPKLLMFVFLASQRNGTFCTRELPTTWNGVYMSIKTDLGQGFTNKYTVTRLVWFTAGEDMQAAIALQKKIKNRGRQWKVNLIEQTNA